MRLSKKNPKYDGEGQIIVEEHLTTFYSFANNHIVENQDVWMRLFVQSLDGESRKWFRGLPTNSITSIEVLDYVFLKHRGDKKDYMYHITEFGSFKRKNGESISDFTKRFNKLYHKIPDEVNPSNTSAKITFSNSFESKFSLLLRERRSPTLASMQEAVIEVEANILATKRLRNKSNRGDKEKKKQKEEKLPSTSSSHTYEDKIEEMSKVIKG